MRTGRLGSGPWAVALGAGVLVLAVVALALGSGGSPEPTEFGRISATVVGAGGGTRQLCLLHAETGQQQRRGLMEVTDRTLGGYDGMVFTFAEDTTAPFWMRNTPLPLSIAYFDARGRLVSTADMAPCGDDADCPRYPPSGEYRYAVEVPRGRLPQLGIVPGARLVLGDRSCRPG